MQQFPCMSGTYELTRNLTTATCFIGRLLIRDCWDLPRDALGTVFVNPDYRLARRAKATGKAMGSC